MREFRAQNWIHLGAVAATFLAPDLRAGERPEASTQPEVPFFSVGPRIGAVAWGTGAQQNECAGPCARFAPDDASYTHLPAFAVGVDALFGAFDRLRFGIGALYVPVSDIRLASAPDDFEVGADVTVDAVAELVVRATHRVSILPRIQGGAIVFSPGGDLRTTLDAVKRDYCTGRVTGCESLMGAYTGWNLAAGAGMLWVSAERVRLRADLLFQYYAVPLYTLSASLANEPIDVSERLTGGRMLLTLGAEFFYSCWRTTPGPRARRPPSWAGRRPSFRLQNFTSGRIHGGRRVAQHFVPSRAFRGACILTAVDPSVLIGAIVRQTTVLLAQIATGTAPGERATLADTANQVFANLVGELRRQGVSSKGIADMFGLTLRTFQHRLSRAAESRTERGTSLWDALHAFLEEHGSATRSQILDRFRADEERSVRGVLRELVEAGLVFRSGSGNDAFFRVARPDEMPQGGGDEPLERLASLLWVAVKRNGPIRAPALTELVPAEEPEVGRALARLVADGRIEARSSGGTTEYVAHEFVIPIGSTAGWEAAVFDHYQALVTTITTKLRVAGRRSADDDWVGGSTYSIELDRDHPMFEEVVGFLRTTRERAVALRRRVAELDAKEGRTPTRPLRVVMYVGQTVFGIDSEGEA